MSKLAVLNLVCPWPVWSPQGRPGLAIFELLGAVVNATVLFNEEFGRNSAWLTCSLCTDRLLAVI